MGGESFSLEYDVRACSMCKSGCCMFGALMYRKLELELV